MNPKIILISGFPGAGKSTFSGQLSQRLGIPCFNKDTVKEVMADGFGIENEELLNRDKKGSAVTFALLLHIAEKFLQTAAPCILESNFQVLYPAPVSESGQIQALLEKYNGECLTFVFTGDPDVIGERYCKRERHWTHAKVDDKEIVKNYCLHSKLDEIAIGQTVQVDATDFAKIDYEGLFATAEEFMGRLDEAEEQLALDMPTKSHKEIIAGLRGRVSAKK